MTCAPNVFTIFQGNDSTINMRADYDTGAPLDLTSASEIDIALPNADGTFAHLLLSLSQITITGAPVLGTFAGVVTSVISALLNPGEFQNIDVTFTISSKKTTVRYFQALTVLEID